MKAARFLIVGLLLASSPSYAYFYTGNQLAEWMRDYERYDRGDTEANLAHATAYLSFVIGVHNAIDGALSCSPEKATASQVAAIVTKYMHANPEELNQPANLMVIRALVQAFPCKATKNA